MDVIICFYKSCRILCNAEELLFCVLEQQVSQLVSEYLEADLLEEVWGNGAERETTVNLMCLKRDGPCKHGFGFHGDLNKLQLTFSLFFF